MEIGILDGWIGLCDGEVMPQAAQPPNYAQ